VKRLAKVCGSWERTKGPLDVRYDSYFSSKHSQAITRKGGPVPHERGGEYFPESTLGGRSHAPDEIPFSRAAVWKKKKKTKKEEGTICGNKITLKKMRAMKTPLQEPRGAFQPLGSCLTWKKKIWSGPKKLENEIRFLNMK